MSLNVFISYSHDDSEHKAWVLKLATHLRSHGVNVVLDQWDLRLGSDLRFFMENGLSSSALVLCVCSETYVNKVNLGSGGAGYEGMIMTQELLVNAKVEYIIPIVRNNGSSNKVPRAFGSKLYIDFSKDEEYFEKYQELLERIYDEDIKKKPPLGKNPFSADLAAKLMGKTVAEIAKYISPMMNGSVSFLSENNNGCYQIGTGEYAFTTRWSVATRNVAYAMGKVGYKQNVHEYPIPDEFIDFDFTSRTRRVPTGSIVLFQNDYGHFAAVKVGNVDSASHGAIADKVEFEYQIYDQVS